MSRPGDRENSVHILDRAPRFDLGAGDGPGVGGFDVIAIDKKLGAVGSEAATPKRRKLRGVDEALGILRCVDHGHDDALGACVKRAADETGVEFGHAHQRRNARGFRGREAGEEFRIAASPMLLIDRDRRPAGLRHDLDAKCRAEPEPCERDRAAGFHEIAEGRGRGGGHGDFCFGLMRFW